MLLQLAGEGVNKNWNEVSKRIGLPKTECIAQYNFLMNKKNRKWSVEEDEQLRASIEKHGTKNWLLIAREIPGRRNKQCY